MKEIVERILKEEEQARRKIEQSRQLGQNQLSQAQADYQQIIASAVEQANQQKAQKTAQVQEESALEKEKALRQLEEDLGRQRQAKDGLIPGLAEKIFSRIITI
jgi:vacuolar-type H+-ATPase subunit H